MISILIFILSISFSGSSVDNTKVKSGTNNVSLLGDPKKKPTRPKRSVPKFPTVYKMK